MILQAPGRKPNPKLRKTSNPRPKKKQKQTRKKK